jgi:hypothetical protein
MKVFLYWGQVKPTRGGLVRADSEEEVEGILREFLLAHGWTILAKERIFEVTPEFAKRDPVWYEAYLATQRDGVHVCFPAFEITEDDIVRELESLDPEMAKRYRMKRKGLLDKDASIVPPGVKIYF